MQIFKSKIIYCFVVIALISIAFVKMGSYVSDLPHASNATVHLEQLDFTESFCETKKYQQYIDAELNVLSALVPILFCGLLLALPTSSLLMHYLYSPPAGRSPPVIAC
ncbi:hypothetical protein KI809_18130 [Geobacter pelophilus]|uniref:Inner membrane protein n=1 Tax=Geoanaerobacter pelophilus TaxID=60036 RepID=A0AAW4LAW0_9BACT|nr:hypothetical protein [Geoanaerobacter pelophilus]MBT0666233.1 hypothetical protein [Geoanaerobacter pelophilus]